MDLSRQTNFLNNYGTLTKDNYSMKICIVGCGGSGSPLAELLVRGGFTTITLLDFDVIEKSNLQRQLYLPENIGKFKAEELKKRCLSINPEATITSVIDQVRKENVDLLLSEQDFIFDATDNFETRFIIDNYAKKHNTYWMYLGAVRAEIICSLMKGKKSHFDKIISKQAENEDCSVGVLGSTTFIGASITYTEFLKYLAMGEKYESKLIKFNIWNNKFFEVKI